MKRYMSGIAFYITWAEAERVHARQPSTILERHKDGSAAIVTLTNTPVQLGQTEYVGG